LSAESFNRLLSDYKRIENTQNGVCDDCVTGYKSAMLEYREVAKELSDRTHELNLNIETIKVQNSKAFALMNDFKRQSGELENIVSLRANLIQENNRQVAELRKSKADLTVSKASLDKARY